MRSIASGARTVAEVTDRCRAGGGCGGCHGRLQALIEASAPFADPVAATPPPERLFRAHSGAERLRSIGQRADGEEAGAR